MIGPREGDLLAHPRGSENPDSTRRASSKPGTLGSLGRQVAMLDPPISQQPEGSPFQGWRHRAQIPAALIATHKHESIHKQCSLKTTSAPKPHRTGLQMSKRERKVPGPSHATTQEVLYKHIHLTGKSKFHSVTTHIIYDRLKRMH